MVYCEFIFAGADGGDEDGSHRSTDAPVPESVVSGCGLIIPIET